MANNYSIQFMSLRAGTTYIVNIGGGTGTPIPLKAGANPFITQEDDDDDMFTPIRTQSGYLRIVDDGLDAKGNAWDWKDLIPATDISRPVTLTHVSSGQTIIDWQGFMQAQDFGSTLYGNPQEREFPVQCVLTVTQGVDINYQQTGIQNFAYLLKQIVDAIPSDQRPTQYFIQGGSYAQQWLLTRIDWQNFVDEDKNGDLIARYSMYGCLENMCRFWGWTARVKGNALYMTCAYNQNITSWLTMDAEQLTTMAGGTAAGNTDGTFYLLDLDILGNIFASADNDEYIQRGICKTTVIADINSVNKSIIDFDTDSIYRQLVAAGWQSVVYAQHGTYRYTNDILSAHTSMMNIVCESGNASLNFAQLYDEENNQKAEVKEIRIKKSHNTVYILPPYATIEMNYEHCYSGNWLELHGSIYQKFRKIGNDFPTLSPKTIKARIGIKRNGYPTKWLRKYNEWGDTNYEIELAPGNNDDKLWLWDRLSEGIMNYERFQIPENLDGTLFIEFLGSDNLDEIDGQRSFELADFKTVMYHGDIAEYNYQTATWWSFENKDDVKNDVKYVSSNQNRAKDELSIDTIFASENNTLYGFGLLINPDRSYFKTMMYPAYLNEMHPEQYLADNATSYGETSKRRIKVDLRKNAIPSVTPINKVKLDDTTTHPIAISHDWWNDIITLTLL